MRGRRFCRSGHSLVELALTLPILVLLTLGAGDFGRVFRLAIALNNAARAGAQYGSQTVITASDTNGMIAAAKQDAGNIANLTVTASRCTCKTGSSVAACPASYCTMNPQGTYVTVNTEAPFKTVAPYPGVPSSMTLSRSASMQVELQ